MAHSRARTAHPRASDKGPNHISVWTPWPTPVKGSDPGPPDAELVAPLDPEEAPGCEDPEAPVDPEPAVPVVVEEAGVPEPLWAK